MARERRFTEWSLNGLSLWVAHRIAALHAHVKCFPIRGLRTWLSKDMENWPDTSFSCIDRPSPNVLAAAASSGSTRCLLFDTCGPPGTVWTPVAGCSWCMVCRPLPPEGCTSLFLVRVAFAGGTTLVGAAFVVTPTLDQKLLCNSGEIIFGADVPRLFSMPGVARASSDTPVVKWRVPSPRRTNRQPSDCS